MHESPARDDLLWLTGPEAAARLAEATESGESPLSLQSRWRKSLSTDRARLLAQQLELRAKARDKFNDADRLFFTPVGLEQATDQWTAERKVERLPSDAPVADLCCGIGGDLMSIARRGPGVGVDRSVEAAVFAEANARAMGGRAEVRACDVEEVDLAEFAAWHIDPDRRPDGRRTTRPELHEPGVDAIDRLRAANPDAAVKLAPAADPPAPWRDAAELEWLSRDRQCRQLVAWFGEWTRSPGAARATVLRTHPSPDGPRRVDVRTFTGEPGVPLAPCDALARYLCEPDAAVLAADLTGALAEEHDLAAPNPAIPYLASDRAIDDLALACFEVVDALPFDRKRLRALLASHEIGRLEIKKRGVDLSPETVRKQLKPSGPRPGVLLLFPIAGQVTAVLAKRVIA